MKRLVVTIFAIRKGTISMLMLVHGIVRTFKAAYGFCPAQRYAPSQAAGFDLRNG